MTPRSDAVRIQYSASVPSSHRIGMHAEPRGRLSYRKQFRQGFFMSSSFQDIYLLLSQVI